MKRFTRPPIGICIHHSLTKDGQVVDAAAIRTYHMSYRHNGSIISKERYAALKSSGARGLETPWGDVGYHALVERVGSQVQVIAGRPLEFQGAHCPALNATHLGLCIVGNFDLAPPDHALLDAAADWCRQQMERFAMALTGITYHCDHAVKTCPGRKFPHAGFLLELAGERRP